MLRTILVGGATAIAAVLLGWGLQALGARSAWFAFLVVWVPMAWLGTVSRFVRPRLAGAYHDLRAGRHATQTSRPSATRRLCLTMSAVTAPIFISVS